MSKQVAKKTAKYVGTTPEEAQRRYAEDSAQAIATGWRVSHVDWEPKASEPTLAATYVPADAEQSPTPPTAEADPEGAPPETASPKDTRSARRKSLYAIGAVVAAVVVAYAILFEPDRTGTTPEPEGGLDGQVGKYEQTWAKDYDKTTCADFVREMDSHERRVMAADYLLASHQNADPAAPRPPDRQVDIMVDGMHEACKGAGEEFGILASEVAGTLYAMSEDMRPPRPTDD